MKLACALLLVIVLIFECQSTLYCSNTKLGKHLGLKSRWGKNNNGKWGRKWCGNQWNLNKLTTRSSSSIDAGSVLGDLYSIRFVRPQTSARTVKTTTRTTTRNIRRPAVYSNIYFTAPAGNWGSSWGQNWAQSWGQNWNSNNWNSNWGGRGRNSGRGMGNYGLRKRFRNLGNRRGGDVNVMINGANRVNVDVNGGWRRRGGRSLNTILDRFGGDVLVNGQRFTSAAFNEAARLSNLFYNTQSSQNLLLSGLRGSRNVYLNGLEDSQVDVQQRRFEPGSFADIEVGDTLDSDDETLADYAADDNDLADVEQQDEGDFELDGQFDEQLDEDFSEEDQADQSQQDNGQDEGQALQEQAWVQGQENQQEEVVEQQENWENGEQDEENYVDQDGEE